MDNMEERQVDYKYGRKSRLKSEMIWKIQKKSELNSEMIWKIWKKVS